MKKLLIFVLVLGMCSVANAAFSWRIEVSASTVTEVNPGDTVTVIVGTTTTSAGGTSSNFTLYADHAESGSGAVTAGMWQLTPSATVSTWGADGLQFVWSGGTAYFPAAAGDYLEHTFDIPAGTAPGTLTISFSGKLLEYDTPAGGSVPIVPEPMTIALLGLGGLFLVRRRT